MKKEMKIPVAAPKPRNPLVALVMKRKSGAHTNDKRVHNREGKDLLQRLREAGL
jgi:hypothetical protein